MGEGENRKFIAKRFNEHTKLLAALFNSLSIATYRDLRCRLRGPARARDKGAS